MSRNIFLIAIAVYAFFNAKLWNALSIWETLLLLFQEAMAWDHAKVLKCYIPLPRRLVPKLELPVLPLMPDGRNPNDKWDKLVSLYVQNFTLLAASRVLFSTVPAWPHQQKLFPSTLTPKHPSTLLPIIQLSAM